jgi:hypothetical protein
MFRLRLRQSLIAAAIAAGLFAPQIAQAQSVTYKTITAHARYLGAETLFAGGSSQTRTTAPGNYVLTNPWMVNRRLGQAQASAMTRTAPTLKFKIPKIKKPPTLVDDSPLGFAGIDAYIDSQANPIGISGLNLVSEPPDQGLCVGPNYVVEVTNTTVAVFDTSGVLQGSPESLYAAMGVPLTNPNAIDLLSDPRCIYDSGSGNFYLTATHFTADGSASDLRVVVFVPFGPAKLYAIPTTNTGSDYPGEPNDPGCPCVEDQPLLGSNSTSVFISGNEFSIANGNFNSVQIYVLSKADLNGGDANNPPAFALFYGLRYLMHHQVLPAFSVSPANSPGGDYDTGNGGTEYFLASLAGLSATVNKIALWAMVGTCALPTDLGTPCANPTVLAGKFVGNKRYLDAPVSLQASGDFPLGQMLRDPEPALDTGDDRMQQVVYSGGVVYGSLTTAVSVGGGIQAGVLWVSVLPKVKVKTKTNKQGTFTKVKLRGKFRGGYLGVAGLDLFYPSIAVNSSGRAVVAFDISGSSIFPSVGYGNVIGGTDLNVHKTIDGVGPDDGFSAYSQVNGGQGTGLGRWGDYSAIVPDSNGNFWFAGEYIAQTCDSATYIGDNTCGGTRSEFANWATRITKLLP